MSALVSLPLKPFHSHLACIAVSYAALPSVVFGYGVCLSQFSNRPPVVSLALPVGVAPAPVVGDPNSARFVLGVAWNRLVGLFWGFPLNGGLFWVGVRGVGTGFRYLG